MKVALLVHGGVDRSGTERVIPALVWLIERLGRRCELHVFARDQENDPGVWELAGARVHNIGRVAGHRRRLLATFAAEHRRAPFDLVHGIFGWGGAWAALLGKRHRLPVLFHATGGEFVALDDIAYGMRRTLRDRATLKLAVGGASRVTVPTMAMQRLAEAYGVDSALVPLGVALDHWPQRSPTPRDTARPARLLHVGDLRPVKDQSTLLAAAAQLASEGMSFTLDVCGLDTMGGLLQRSEVARILAPHVRWHGVVDRAGVRALMLASDLLLVSSRHEAEPFVVLEAAIAGVPTVGTSVGHVQDWSPSAAVAVPVGDAPALAAATRDLIADDARRLSIAREAQRRALAIDVEHTATAFGRIYHELCAG